MLSFLRRDHFMACLGISRSSGTKPVRVIQVSSVALDITVIFPLLTFTLLTVYLFH